MVGFASSTKTDDAKPKKDGDSSIARQSFFGMYSGDNDNATNEKMKLKKRATLLMPKVMSSGVGSKGGGVGKKSNAHDELKHVAREFRKTAGFKEVDLRDYNLEDSDSDVDNPFDDEEELDKEDDVPFELSTKIDEKSDRPVAEPAMLEDELTEQLLLFSKQDIAPIQAEREKNDQALIASVTDYATGNKLIQACGNNEGKAKAKTLMFKDKFDGKKNMKQTGIKYDKTKNSKGKIKVMASFTEKNKDVKG